MFLAGTAKQYVCAKSQWHPSPQYDVPTIQWTISRSTHSAGTTIAGDKEARWTRRYPSSRRLLASALDQRQSNPFSPYLSGSIKVWTLSRHAAPAGRFPALGLSADDPSASICEFLPWHGGHTHIHTENHHTGEFRTLDGLCQYNLKSIDNAYPRQIHYLPD